MSVQVKLLGGFGVTVDGVPVASDVWVRRQAAQLVQLLALTRDRRMHREQVIDALWPGLSWDTAAPRLHKAAHYARRALDDADAVVLRQELVGLYPGRDDVEVDVHEFTRTAQQALRTGDATLAAEALEWYAGPLLPEDPYSTWSDEPRTAARQQHLDLLRLLGRWDDVLAGSPPTRTRTWPWPGRAPPAATSAVHWSSSSGWRRRCAASSVPLRDRRPCGCARSSSGAPPRPGEGHRPGPPRRALRPLVSSGVAAWVTRYAASSTRRTRAGRHRAGRGSGRSGEVGGPRPGRRAGSPKGLEGGARSRLVGGGPVALLAGARSAQRTVPSPPRAAGRPGRQLSSGDRACPDRTGARVDGENSHQRLFVAAAELLRVAAAGSGLVLMVDDVHDADEASLRLLHYLSRFVVDEKVVLVLAHREPAPAHLEEVTASMVSRGAGLLVELDPLDAAASQRLLIDRFPDLDPDAAGEIAQTAGGLPFPMIEMARARVSGSGSVPAMLPPDALRTFQRVALLGQGFSTDELLAISDGSEDETYDQLELALAALVVEPGEAGFRFRHPLVREGLVREVPPHERSRGHQRVAEALARLDRPPSQVAHHYLAAGLASRAVPYAVQAVEIAGALGAYRDALTLVDGVREHAGPDHLPGLLARRGDLLMSLGEPGAVEAYTEAARITTGTRHRLVRARLARAAAVGGDLEVARSALAGLDLEGDEADASLLLGQGMLAYFTGDMETARRVAAEARERLRGIDDPWQVVDLVGLHGLLAHHRGEWFPSFRTELRRTHGQERLAGALFDAHLCVAENLLYGREPYPEIIAEAEQLRLRARMAGALRGVAFASALIGEAALMMGDLTRAEAELEGAITLNADLDALGGQAHGMQRLAEVRLAQGRPDEARQLLDEALLLARWSPMGMHVLQRIFGTLIASEPDPQAARLMVDRAEDTLGEPDLCWFCTVMLAVPAATACARVGDLEDAHRFLASASRSVELWGETSWKAAVLEAHAEVALAEGDAERCRTLSREAAEAYSAVGHAGDAARCLAAAASC